MGFFTNRKVKKLQAVLEKGTGDARTILKLADDLIGRGKMEQAGEALEQLAGQAEDSGARTEAAVRLGRLALLAGEWLEAQEAFTAVLENPGTFRGEATVGILNAVLGRWEKADPDLRPALLDAAQSYLHRAEVSQLPPALQRSHSLARARLLEIQGQMAEAYQVLLPLEAEIARDREASEKARLDIAMRTLTLALSAAPEAVPQHVEKALKLAYEDGDRGKVLLLHGRFLKGRNPAEAKDRLETAARYLSAVKPPPPELAEATLELIRLYLQTRQYPQAVSEAEKGLKAAFISPNGKGEVLQLLIEAAEKDQNPAKALSTAKQLLDSAPSPHLKSVAERELGRLLLKEDRPDEAVAYLAEAVRSESLEGEGRARVALLYAEALQKTGKALDAMPILRELQREELPRDIKVRLFEILGDTLLATGRVVEAVENFSRLAAEQTDERSQEIARDRLRDVRVDLESGKLAAILSDSDREKLREMFGLAVGEAGYFERLRVGLSKTHEGLVSRMEALISGKNAIDDDMLDEMEEILISADIGVNTTLAIMEVIRGLVDRKKLTKPEDLLPQLKTQIYSILTERESRAIPIESQKPFVLMVVGVNGAGKTTTIAKLARRYHLEGKRVILAAADTFRAGAVDQLTIWAERVGCEIVKHDQGADPSAVVFDAIHAAKSREADLLIIDTAGRLHTKVNLMEEMKKMRRIADREYPGAPHETLLVLDGTTGQNAISQAKLFNEALPIDGIALTKLDGTAKGGIVVTITHELKIPVKLIGIGERYDDLRDFEPRDFAEALFAPKPVSAGASSKQASAES